jgi:hypothetical protein
MLPWSSGFAVVVVVVVGEGKRGPDMCVVVVEVGWR